MNFLVPFDFTPITRSALDHALEIRKKIGGEIELLHIISKEEERAETEKKFAQSISTVPKEEQQWVRTKIRIGDIYTDISKEADEGNFKLLIMGTHGAKGLQKLFGSRAIRVITSAKTPFIVTQSKGPSKSIDLIVLPVDLTKESVQIVRFAADIAKKFNAEIHLVCAPETDEWLAKKIKININSAKLYLSKEGVKHEVYELEGKDSLDKEVINYGAKYRADLFAVVHFTESILPQFEKFSQHMITNKLEVPVLILNAKPIENIEPNFAFLTM